MISGIKNFSTLGLLLLVLSTTACSPNPKKKCDTCPKWKSENVQTLEATIHLA